MTPSTHAPVSAAFLKNFVGREAPLDRFRACLEEAACRGLYFCGPGGVGKTWLLRRIRAQYADQPDVLVLDIVDFYDTGNRSIRDLQTSLRRRLKGSEGDAFAAYDVALAALRTARRQGDVPSVITGLDARANRRFVEGLHAALRGHHRAILLFDTFERVQNRDVGQWLLNELLPVLDNVRVAIVGRPGPVPAEMPPSIEPWPLAGFNAAEAQAFMARQMPGLTAEEIAVIRDHTNGAPLYLSLIADLRDEEERTVFMDRLRALPPGRSIQEEPELQKILVKPFTHLAPEQRETTLLFWAMSYLHRRFNVDILRYLIEHSSDFPSGSYTELYADLRRSPYIKELPEAQHHLLHDEVRKLIQKHVLGEMAGVARALWGEVQRVIVEAYYTKAIADAKSDDDGAVPSPDATGTTELERQLRAERFGYALDDVRYAPAPKRLDLHAEEMAHYEGLIKEIVATKDYAFEELVWNEVREYLHALPAAVAEHTEMTETYHNRGNFLLRHSLFRKLEQHYLEFTRQFGEERPIALFYLAFAQLRQGDLTKAQVAAQKAQTLIPPADHVRQAQIASIRGQITRADGRWEEAAAHYERAVDEAIEAGDDRMLASALVNRAFLWAQQADYVLARRECERAIDLLEGLGEETSRRRIYAHMNLATAYRYEGEHDQARKAYQESLDRAQQADDEEARCDVLAHLGINEHLAGRELRRELLESGVCKMSDGGVPSECQAAFNGASGLQLRAWNYLMQALEIAQPTEWFRAIADAYHRLAKIYREIYRLDDLLADAQEGLQTPEALDTLKQKARQYVPRFEPVYEGRLLTETEFSKLGFWGQAVRLFDLSWLLAIEANDTHRALDALTEMARMAFEQRQPDILELVIEIVETQAGYGYMETLFSIMNEIAQGDLYFIRWEQDQSAERQRFLDQALEQYQAGFVHLAQQSGYADYLLFDRLRDLRWRLDFLSRDQALHWLRALRDAWRPQLRRNEKWPRILAFLQEEHYKHRKRIA